MSGLSGAEIAAATGQCCAGANESHWRSLANVLFNDLRRGVGRATIGDHNLVGRARLGKQAIEQLADRILFISHRNDDTDLHKPQDLATKRHKKHINKSSSQFCAFCAFLWLTQNEVLQYEVIHRGAHETTITVGWRANDRLAPDVETRIDNHR